MALIALTRGLTAVVDDADYDGLIAFKWFAADKRRGMFYAARGKKHGETLLHRLIIGARAGEIVDHINGNTLDNRRENLRFCSASQSVQNRNRPRSATGKFRGVYPDFHRFRAEICADNRRYYLGRFASAEDAAVAYDAAALRLHGTFARLNFPDAGEQQA